MAGASEDWQVRVAALSDVGPMRSHNEDVVAVLVPDEVRERVLDLQWTTGRTRRLATAGGVGLLVLDGCGGHSTNVSCSLVLTALGAGFAAGLPAEPETRGAGLADALRRASAHTKEHGTPGGGQGATAALAVVYGATVHVLHVGDVRVYLLRDGRLEQRTRDDSLRNLALDQGIAEADLGEVPRGVITQALGFGDVDPHLQRFTLVAGDVLLLCSDGLHKSVPAAALAATLRRNDDPAQACAELIAMAVRARSGDNISALVARLERGE